MGETNEVLSTARTRQDHAVIPPGALKIKSFPLCGKLFSFLDESNVIQMKYKDEINLYD